MKKPLVTLRDAALGYDGRPILEHVTLDVADGEFLALLGPNGAGKTTLLRGIVGLLPVLSGSLRYEFDRGASPVAYVPQRDMLDAIFPLTVHEVVLMGTYARLGPLRGAGTSERRRASAALGQVGMQHAAEERYSSLSGGQKQRVLIARALAAEPRLLVLDEPTAGVDASAAAAIMDVLGRLHRERGLAILLVTHQVRLLHSYVDAVLWVHGGAVERGEPASMLEPQRLTDLLSATGTDAAAGPAATGAAEAR